MDRTLLETPMAPTAEEHTNPNNDGLRKAVDLYRDLEVENAKPALRMRIDPPLDYDGQQWSELIFDFDAMNGKDFVRAEREFNRLYKPDKDEVVLPETKHLYHQIMAAHRANVPLGVIQKLPRRYYTPLRVEVLKACGSSPDEEKA